MVEIISSSFIPKNEFKKKKEDNRGGGLNIFFLIALIIFLTTIVASVGVYLYKNNLEKENSQLAAEFSKSKGDWAIDSIREFSKISRKIKFSKELLKSHYNVLPVFTYLESKTLKDVTLKQFSLTENYNFIIVKASGEAPALTDLQLQSKSYAENLNVTDLVLSNITKTKDGYSSFDLSFTVDKKFLTSRTF